MITWASASEINTVTRSNNFTCDPKVKYSVANVNYPSFAIPLQSGGGNGSTILKYTRTLTNVGPAATYNASVNMQNESVKVMVEPSSLTFSQVNDKQSYTVQFTVSSLPLKSFSYGSIEWGDGKHVVKSSIVISWRWSIGVGKGMWGWCLLCSLEQRGIDQCFFKLSF